MRQRADRREWRQRVSRWRRSGKTSREFAAATGLNARTLLWWSTKLRGERALREGAPQAQSGRAVDETQVRFVEVDGGVSDDRFELELSHGRRLRIPPAFDAAALERLLTALK